MNKPMLSIVVAVYNESTYNLQAVIERLNKVFSPLNFSYEVVFVNDGSREETSNSLNELCQQHDYIKLVSLSRNFGQQAAISAGMDFASGQAIVNIDSDLQDPPELIPDMVRLWQSGFHVVYAKRSSRKDKLLKRFTAFLFYRLMSAVSSIEIPQDTGEFRLIDRKVAKALQQLPERTRYIRGLIPWLGFKQTTIPVDRGARQHGESTYTVRKLIALAIDGMLCFSYAPLYAIIAFGLLSIFASISVPIISNTFFPNNHPHLVLLIGGIVFLFGLQFLLLGIVTLYIAKIFDEVRGRPIYIVSEIAGRPFEINKRSNKRTATNQKEEFAFAEFDADPKSLFSYSEKIDYMIQPDMDQTS